MHCTEPTTRSGEKKTIKKRIGLYSEVTILLITARGVRVVSPEKKKNKGYGWKDLWKRKV